MVQPKQKERRRSIEQGLRETYPFIPYAGSRVSYLGHRWEDDERSPPQVRAIPRNRQRRRADYKMREQSSLVLTPPRRGKDIMAPLRTPMGSTNMNKHNVPWESNFPGGYDTDRPTPREIIAKREGPMFASPFCNLLADWTE